MRIRRMSAGFRQMTSDCGQAGLRMGRSPLTIGLAIALGLQLLLVPSIKKGMKAGPAIDRDQYGIDRNELVRENRTIRRGETLASLMLSSGVAANVVHQATRNARSVMDLRRIRAGDPFLVYSDQETQQAAVFVYKPSPEKYVTFDLRDSVAVYAGYLPARKVQRTLTGIVQSDLYSVLAQAELTNALTAELVRLFGWRISFQHLQAGDRLAVIYEDHVVDGTAVAVNVLAARIVHRQSDYYVFRHHHDGEVEYLDQNGRSVRGQFLRAPVDYTRISSRYSLRRFHPVQRRYKAHLGTDFAAPTGTPVFSTADGVVTRAAYGTNNGRYVRIQHGGTYQTAYLHLSRIASGIRPGTKVHQGQVIGYVGSTGLANGPHVCYRFWIDGVQVDPLRLAFSALAEIPESELPEFGLARDSLMQTLDVLDRPMASNNQ